MRSGVGVVAAAVASLVVSSVALAIEIEIPECRRVVNLGGERYRVDQCSGPAVATPTPKPGVTPTPKPPTTPSPTFPPSVGDRPCYEGWPGWHWSMPTCPGGPFGPCVCLPDDGTIPPTTPAPPTATPRPTPTRTPRPTATPVPGSPVTPAPALPTPPNIVGCSRPCVSGRLDTVTVRDFVAAPPVGSAHCYCFKFDKTWARLTVGQNDRSGVNLCMASRLTVIPPVTGGGYQIETSTAEPADQTIRFFRQATTNPIPKGDYQVIVEQLPTGCQTPKYRIGWTY